ncbi:MAG: hypothetical protein JW801_08670 [Bacteroidales bacterium]|nr:hypothetical protein [Bacteroidales bacterium]
MKTKTDTLYQHDKLIREAMNYDPRYKQETIEFDTIDQKFPVPLKTAVNQYTKIYLLGRKIIFAGYTRS